MSSSPPTGVRPDPPPDADPESTDRSHPLERFGERIGGGSLLATIGRLTVIAITVVNAVLFVPRMVADEAWIGVVVTVLASVALLAVYLTKRAVPLKYLVPGTLLLLVFQAYPVAYTGFIAFTNYGTGNVLDKDQAVDRIVAASVQVPEDATRYDAAGFAAGDGPDAVALLLTDPEGDQFLGLPEEGLVPLDEAGEVVTEGDQVTAVGDYTRLDLREIQDRQAQFSDLTIPVTGDSGEVTGAIRLQTFTSAAQAEPTRVYDPVADTLTDTVTGVVYTPVEGTFTSPDGEVVTPGWRVLIGFDNFTRAFTSPLIRGPFLRVFVWNYVFALGSVFLTFALGLGLAITLDHDDLRGKRVYRSLMIVPYALPGFMTALIWAGLLNTEFGAVNRMLGATIPWLDSPWLAKVSILLVNLWLGFPYMFLVCTGALQAIPGEVKEAAKVDGASAFQGFRNVTMPLLLITVAPLLIASFAFNFNNFNTVYLVTQGGPPIVGAQTPAGPHRHPDQLRLPHRVRVRAWAGLRVRVGDRRHHLRHGGRHLRLQLPLHARPRGAAMSPRTSR